MVEPQEEIIIFSNYELIKMALVLVYLSLTLYCKFNKMKDIEGPRA